MNLETAFKNFIKQQHLFSQKDHLLIAVSGGVDSVVLCALCKKAGYNFSIAHCNFQLRGQESDADETFVKSIAEKYTVPFYIQKFDTEKYATKNKVSIQVAARELRYHWFKELSSQSTHQPTFIATAHHADDNIETIAMNFFKGTGINGLKGILAKNGNIVRPLLFAGKETINGYAIENKLAYREDSSNSSEKYTRNYFRNNLLPALQKIFPEVKENLLQNAERFKEINKVYIDVIEKTKAKLLLIKGSEIHIPVLKLQKTIGLPTVLHEIISEFNFTSGQLNDVLQLLNADTGKYVSSSTHRILLNRKWLIIYPLEESASAQYVIEDNSTSINFPLGKLDIEITKAPFAISKEPSVAMLNVSHIQFPLILRKWKTGDYFYPLGMRKKKKISRFLIDQKIPLHQKEQTWVLESNKKIIWVVGQRIDDRCKLTGSELEMLTLRLHPLFQTN